MQRYEGVVRDPVIATRFALAFDLHDMAVQLVRQRLRRELPAASEDEIEARLVEWLRRPAEDGRLDADPTPSP